MRVGVFHPGRLRLVRGGWPRPSGEKRLASTYCTVRPAVDGAALTDGGSVKARARETLAVFQAPAAHVSPLKTFCVAVIVIMVFLFLLSNLIVMF